MGALHSAQGDRMEFTFVAIDRWPARKTKNRKDSRFRGPYRDTCAILDVELRKLGAQHIVIQTFMTPNQIRKDGLPKAGISQPSDPGVVLSFFSAKQKAYRSFPCDRFRDWTDNLRAIAKTLQALSAIDRYGVTESGQQYQGFEALPPPGVDPSMDFSDEEAAQAARLIGRFSGMDPLKILDGTIAADAIRMAEIKSHPDKGGTADDFMAVRRAKQILQRGRA